MPWTGYVICNLMEEACKTPPVNMSKAYQTLSHKWTNLNDKINKTRLTSRSNISRNSNKKQPLEKAQVSLLALSKTRRTRQTRLLQIRLLRWLLIKIDSSRAWWKRCEVWGTVCQTVLLRSRKRIVQLVRDRAVRNVAEMRDHLHALAPVHQPNQLKPSFPR